MITVMITITITTVGLPPLTSAEYFCSRLRDGFYDVFYPPVQVLDAQLALRNASELGNTVPPFVGELAVNEFFNNPVQNNIWVSDST
jgi:hypothetical protein